jgi:hypothetical protein
VLSPAIDAMPDPTASKKALVREVASICGDMKITSPRRWLVGTQNVLASSESPGRQAFRSRKPRRILVEAPAVRQRIVFRLTATVRFAPVRSALVRSAQALAVRVTAP